MKIETKDIIRIANDLDSTITNSEKFAVPILAVRAKKGALNHPNDQTLRLMSNVLSKMSESGKLFISKGEFNSIYTKFATKNSKALEYFENELSSKESSEQPQRELAGKQTDEISLYAGADDTILNAFSSMWDDNGKAAKVGEYKAYNTKTANKANDLTSLEFARLGVTTKDVTTFAGTDKFILCDAICETPNGDSHIIVPVEISASGVLIPVMFINRNGFVDLNEKTLEQHFHDFAGKNLNVNSEKIFEILHTASNVETLDEFGLQVMAAKNAVNQNKQIDTSIGDLLKVVGCDEIVKSASTGDFSDYNSMLGKLYDMSEVRADKETVDKFSSYLESNKGMAELNFGRNIVDNGRNIIASKVSSFGYKPQITVTSCDENSITYAVAITTRNGPLGFEVISEVQNNKAVVPYIMAISDKVYDFTREGMEHAVNDKVIDNRVLAAVSPLYDLKSSEIVKIVRQAASNGDYKTAEEALNVLSEKTDFENYAMALNEYVKGLNGEITKEACHSTQCKCTKIVKASNREKPLCGHLNLPLDQVYQDKNGNCTPKYRANMSDTYEGMLFNTSKIFS
jgi:hypothetical protein